MDGDILFTIETYGTESEDEERESVLYNPTANTFTRRFGKMSYSCFDYVESLFQLSEGQHIINYLL